MYIPNIIFVAAFLNQDSKIGNFIFLSGTESGENKVIYVDHWYISIRS